MLDRALLMNATPRRRMHREAGIDRLRRHAGADISS
jgi:hypothetical protein